MEEFNRAMGRAPTSSEIADAVRQGHIASYPNGLANYPAGLAPGYGAESRPKVGRAFAYVALGSLLLGFVSLFLPIASFFGYSIGWFDEELGNEGVLLLILILTSTVFVIAHVHEKHALRVFAALVAGAMGIFMMLDGFGNMSNIGGAAGASPILMGLSGLGL